MSTQEVADKLVSLCRAGKYDEAYGLYAQDAVSVEMPGVPNEVTEGLDNILKGFEEWAGNIQEAHGGTVGDPVVSGNHFVVPMTSDVTFKDGRRVNMEELCLYQVEAGKIKKASFHYNPSAMF
ncbi:nuclear transport factor 2 family protein [Muricauda sp. JGD-17]|uniref:Nuclear transport factor 2 family protein n=1 Tax=Flagellimonas ochracea TaxID=2696472 RepID=A0A964TCA1_9FLAO|nr:nuclear transport factor 2 family protein [Allomuricauda ochracea]NAY91619.1 nuclear transport factor 2 family protein [Allomuricauda ochracea]